MRPLPDLLQRLGAATLAAAAFLTAPAADRDRNVAIVKAFDITFD